MSAVPVRHRTALQRRRDALTPGDLARYHTRVAELAPADVLTWLHYARDLGSR